MLTNPFKPGDLVVPAAGEINWVQSNAGLAKFGEYFIDTVDGQHVTVRASGAETATQFKFLHNRFTLLFKLGDTVRVRKESFSTTSRRFHNTDLTVDLVTADRIRVMDEGGSTLNADKNVFRIVRKQVRVEGAEIKPENIKVGDTIRVSKVSGKMTMIHEAVVGDIKRQTDTKNFGNLLFYTERFSDTAQRINWSKDSDETFTLVKAAPERDVLLDRLVGSLAGQVITYRETWARKHGDEAWDVVVQGRLSVLSTDNLRTNISGSPVTFLKAESA